MAWCQTGDKPFPKPVLTLFSAMELRLSCINPLIYPDTSPHLCRWSSTRFPFVTYALLPAILPCHSITDFWQEVCLILESHVFRRKAYVVEKNWKKLHHCGIISPVTQKSIFAVNHTFFDMWIILSQSVHHMPARQVSSSWLQLLIISPWNAFCITGPLWGNPQFTSGSLSQMASNAEVDRYLCH